jgi:hypothetical protein
MEKLADCGCLIGWYHIFDHASSRVLRQVRLEPTPEPFLPAKQLFGAMKFDDSVIGRAQKIKGIVGSDD